jgi:very-short-patch-repair endonuclease
MHPVREYRFAEPRKWRFDFAFCGSKLAVEIEGGTWNGGRHSRGSGMAADMEKYNTAVKLGWRVLRYTTEMVLEGTAINEVIEILGK